MDIKHAAGSIPIVGVVAWRAHRARLTQPGFARGAIACPLTVLGGGETLVDDSLDKPAVRRRLMGEDTKLPDPREAEHWRRMLDRHGPALVLFARQWSASLADAEDAVQEAFVRFWPSRERPRDQVAYLY